MDMIVGKDFDITQLFQEEWQPPKSPLEREKRRGGRLETEEFYLSVSISFNTCGWLWLWLGFYSIATVSAVAGCSKAKPSMWPSLEFGNKFVVNDC